jgi:hypothetical protein
MAHAAKGVLNYFSRHISPPLKLLLNLNLFRNQIKPGYRISLALAAAWLIVVDLSCDAVDFTYLSI